MAIWSSATLVVLFSLLLFVFFHLLSEGCFPSDLQDGKASFFGRMTGRFLTFLVRARRRRAESRSKAIERRPIAFRPRSIGIERVLDRHFALLDRHRANARSPFRLARSASSQCSTAFSSRSIRIERRSIALLTRSTRIEQCWIAFSTRSVLIEQRSIALSIRSIDLA
jgi:hypothetical protein